MGPPICFGCLFDHLSVEVIILEVVCNFFRQLGTKRRFAPPLWFRQVAGSVKDLPLRGFEPHCRTQTILKTDLAEAEVLLFFLLFTVKVSIPLCTLSWQFDS